MRYFLIYWADILTLSSLKPPGERAILNLNSLTSFHFSITLKTNFTFLYPVPLRITVLIILSVQHLHIAKCNCSFYSLNFRCVPYAFFNCKLHLKKRTGFSQFVSCNQHLHSGNVKQQTWNVINMSAWEFTVLLLVMCPTSNMHIVYTLYMHRFVINCWRHNFLYTKKPQLYFSPV